MWWPSLRRERLTVRGVLRVIRHKGDVVNGAVVPAWLEVRVAELW
jgi:hypothetical protein